MRPFAALNQARYCSRSRFFVLLFYVLLSSCHHTHGLWAVVGGAFWAPSNELVGNAACAFSTARARSTGVSADRRPLRMLYTRRSGRGPTRSIPPQPFQGAHASVVPFPADGPSASGFRREGPPSVRGYARWRTRSRIASAMVGSPRYSCQRSLGS